MKYREIKGNLIELAKVGSFDVIAHGCNCWCTMGAGIAPQMAKAFGCDKFKLEDDKYRGSIYKLGNIDFNEVYYLGAGYDQYSLVSTNHPEEISLMVVNAYTQYGFGLNHLNGTPTPLDYEALTLCLRKINAQFAGARIGLPQIGCGLAGGNWNKVKRIIKNELKDCKTTVVIYEN